MSSPSNRGSGNWALRASSAVQFVILIDKRLSVIRISAHGTDLSDVHLQNTIELNPHLPRRIAANFSGLNWAAHHKNSLKFVIMNEP